MEDSFTEAFTAYSNAMARVTLNNALSSLAKQQSEWQKQREENERIRQRQNAEYKRLVAEHEHIMSKPKDITEEVNKLREPKRIENGDEHKNLLS